MATSPTNLTVPAAAKKRPLTTGPPSQSSSYVAQTASKRPKHDHPLRQTSFPASEAEAGVQGPLAARSETGSVSNSLVSGMSSTTGAGNNSGKPARARPKKRKSQPRAIQTGRDGDEGGGGGYDDDGSIVSGSRNSRKQPNSKRRRGAAALNTEHTTATSSTAALNASAAAAAATAIAPEDDDELLPATDPNSSESLRLQSELAQEKEKIAKLQDALTAEQMARYVVYNRTKIKQSTLRRIVNQTVSQSVAPNPLQALQWVAKVFVGEMVEGARGVRDEWGQSWEMRRQPTDTDNDKTNHTTAHPTPTPTNPHHGGLLPDHLREALRRYRAAGEGGGTGLAGFSFGLLGVKGEAVGRVGMGSGSGSGLFR